MYLDSIFRKTNINGETHDNFVDVLRTVFFCLMIHPGSSVPDTLKKSRKRSELHLKDLQFHTLKTHIFEKDYIECLLLLLLLREKDLSSFKVSK